MADDQQPTEEPKVEVTEATPASGTLTTDDDNEPKTEAFIAMRQEIKELKDQIKARESNAPVFQPPQVPTPPSWTPQDDRNQFVNPTTGEFNIDGYDNAVNQRIASSNAATLQAAEGRAKYESELMATRAAYPELDPDSDKYNKELEEDVASRYYFNKFQNKGQDVSLKTVAKQKIDAVRKETAKQEAQLIAEDNKVVATKEAASLNTPAQTAGSAQQAIRQEESETDNEISWRSRGISSQVKGYDSQGNPIHPKVSKSDQEEAIIARLKKIPVAQAQRSEP